MKHYKLQRHDTLQVKFIVCVVQFMYFWVRDAFRTNLQQEALNIVCVAVTYRSEVVWFGVLVRRRWVPPCLDEH